MRDALRDYRSKRNFSRTAEPRAARPAKGRGRKFVVQKHAATRLHFDLRLEVDGVFRSWAVTRGPSVNPKDKRLAVEVENHPLAYGNFEGSIPEGEYGGGTVQLWDQGEWVQESPGPASAALRKGELKFSLQGKRLRGGWVLVRMRDDKPDAKRHNWLLIKHQDRYAGNDAATAALLKADSSIASGKSMRELARPAESRRGKRQRKQPSLPRFIPPQLCTLVPRPPAGEQWGHEVKFDGYRIQLRIQDGEAVLRTRKGLDWSGKFTAIAAAAKRLPDCILDGEVVALNPQGAPDFALLQAALSAGTTTRLVYFAFDLLATAEGDLTSLPLAERKARLEKLLGKAGKHRLLRYVEHFIEPGDAVLESACRMDLEGIVSKRLDAPYQSGRSTAWTKAKCRGGQEIVIGGWTEVGGQLRSLLAGVHRNGKLVYVGRVGTGFGRAQTKLVLPRLRAMRSESSPFAANAGTGPNVRWARPELVAEIEFAGWTQAGQIRQAAFKGLRQDKRPQEIERERPVSPRPDSPMSARTNKPRVANNVPLSHPGKILWPRHGKEPERTKLDLLDYYSAVGEWMLPHLRGRPCSIVRAPDGIAGQTFFQRHAMTGMSNLVKVIKLAGDPKPYLQIDRVEALAALAQWATVELHPGNCAPGKPEVPGRLVFDLDPGPDVRFDAVIAAALEIKERVEQAGLIAFCKTTGGKGLHVVTPLATQRSRLTWPQAKAFARRLCEEMAADAPEKYVVQMAKKLRTGRIFLDYLRNDRLATAVAPLSPRARDGAPVSLPLNWKQVVKGLDPQRYSLHQGMQFARTGDAWAGYADSERLIPRRLLKGDG